MRPLRTEEPINHRGPARFLLLSSVRAGGGHWSAAGALAEALTSLGQGQVSADIVDAQSGPYLRFPASQMTGGYEPLTRTWVGLWSSLFWLTNGDRRVELGRWLSQPLLNHQAFNRLAATEPTAVISTIPLLHQPRFLRRGLRSLGIDVPFIQIVTDPVTVHRSWLADEIDLYIAQSQLAEQTLVDTHRVPPGKVRHIGAITGPQFAPAVDKQAVRRTLGLDPTAFTVLIAGGGAGVGPIKELAEAIQAARLDVQLVIVCGHNEVLRRRLVDRLDRERCQVHGFVRNLHELMQASDILLSKSGPGTVAEALACGLPVFITSCTSGTESGNAEFYESLGVARFVPEVNRCVEALREMASGDRGEIDGLRANIDKGAPWNRTPTIADEIRRFCRQAEQEASLGFAVRDLARSGAGVVWERG